MRRTSFWMAVAAFLLVLTACGDKKANQTENGGESADSLVENERVEALDENEEVFSDDEALKKIQTTWSKESIEGLRPEENGLDIVELALAFCDKYSDFEPNKQLVNYFTRRDQFDSNWFIVKEQLQNGYVECLSGSEVIRGVTACYWKQKNGHRLVAFWLERGHEGSDNVDGLLAFYDYDPEADEMTPKPELTQRVEKTMSKFDSYSVRLPDEGKDIILMGYTPGADEDSYEIAYYLFKWNGNGFDLVEADEDELFG